MNEQKSPIPPNPLHPQAKSLGKNRLNNPKKEKDTVSAQPVTPNTPTVAAVSAPPASASPVTAPVLNRAGASPGPPAPKPAAAPPVPKDPAPGKDKSYFELTIKLVGTDEPPFVVEVPLTGNGANDKANATSVARKKYAGRAMTIVSARIYQKTENATEILPGSTLSALFGASGEITGDLIEIGKAFYDGSRGTLFLRNLRTHVGLTFRPATGGLAVFSNRIVSNRLASELPLIVAEILGNNAREIEIYLKP